MIFEIANKKVGIDCPPFVIAEMSGNHNNNINRALEIVEAAAKAGAHAVKLQTYTADTLTLDVKGGDFEIKDKGSLWYGKNLYDLYQVASTPWEWHSTLMEKARELGILCFSSPFDETAVDFLENLNVPAYKIASFENNHLPLIRKVASTKKPLIISTGMASIGDIEMAVNTARDAGAKQIALLKCTSSYPASPIDTNLNTIPHLKKMFNCQVGLSDHTKGIGVSVGAVAMGATIIEKHFTLDRSEGGVDSEFSLEPNEMESLVNESYRCWQSIGSIKYGLTEEEKKSIIFRRSIYVSEDIKEGEIFTKKNIRIVRPGFGDSPSFYEKIIGKRSRHNINKGTPLKLENII